MVSLFNFFLKFKLIQIYHLFVVECRSIQKLSFNSEISQYFIDFVKYEIKNLFLFARFSFFKNKKIQRLKIKVRNSLIKEYNALSLN